MLPLVPAHTIVKPTCNYGNKGDEYNEHSCGKIIEASHRTNCLQCKFNHQQNTHRLQMSRNLWGSPGFSSLICPWPFNLSIVCPGILENLHIMASTIISLVAKWRGFVSYWLLLSVVCWLDDHHMTLHMF